MIRRKISLVSVVITALVLVGLGAGAFIFRAQEATSLNPAKTYYVSPTGSDATGDGSIDNPFQTIDKSRLAVRNRNKSGEGVGPIVVYLRQGNYEHASRLNFDSGDSGTEANPIIYRSYPGEHALVSGAKTVTGVTAVTDPTILNRFPTVARPNVVVFDLAANGLTAGDPLKGTSSTFAPTWPLFVAQGGTTLPLARYPNPADPW